MTTKNDEDTLIRSTALQNATSILIARQRAEQRNEAYLTEAQRLSHTGSFGWRVRTDEISWSEETSRIFQYDRTTKPTVDLILQRVHADDVALVKQTIERASQDGKDFEHEYRLVMPDGSIKHVHVVAHAFSDEGRLEFVGAVMDVTERKRAETLLAGEKRLLEMIARGESRPLVLDALCRVVEELVSGSLSSILLLDSNARCLRHGAAPSLPRPYCEAIDGAAIGPSAGSCGTAAYRAEPVIVSDIATDPLWADYRDLALAHGLRACCRLRYCPQPTKCWGPSRFTIANLAARLRKSMISLNRSAISRVSRLSVGRPKRCWASRQAFSTSRTILSSSAT
jgi:PAS domain S-box-containing protein